MIKSYNVYKDILLVFFLFILAFCYTFYTLNIVFILLFLAYFVSERLFIKLNIYIPLFISFSISLINTNRFPTHDLGTYIQRYNSFGKLELTSFIQSINSDFIFYYVGKFLYLISNGNQELFIFFWSFVIYFLISSSMNLLYSNKTIKKDTYIFVLIILFFSTTFISLSSHLIRQMVTGSLFIYYLTNLYFGKKKTYLLFVMIFIHFSSLLLLMSLYIKNKKFFFLISIITFIILLTGINIFELIFSNIPTFNNSYLNFIMYQINGAINKVKNDGDVSIITYATSLILLTYLILSIKYDKRKDLLIFFFPFLFSFLLFNIFAPIQLLWLRFSFYQYPFYFILFCFFFNYFEEKMKFIKIGYWFLSIFYFYIFYNYFENAHWIDLNKKINIVNFGLLELLKLN